jgi:ketosteroid isomerase-like protein
MHRVRNAMLSVVTLVALAACANPPAANTAAEEQAIRDASAAWMKAVQGHDWAAASTYFAPDGMTFPEHEQPLVGPAAVQAHSEAHAEEMANIALSWTPEKVVVAASGDLAYEVGSWTVTGNENANQNDNGKYVTVWQKVNGAWKAGADIGVSTKPQADSTKM